MNKENFNKSILFKPSSILEEFIRKELQTNENFIIDDRTSYY